MGTNYYVEVTSPSLLEELESKLGEERENLQIKILECALDYKFKDIFDILKTIESSDKTVNKIHIGKLSAGWEFIFNRNYENYYELTRESIDKFIRGGVLMDEYGYVVSINEFWKIVDESKGKQYNELTTFSSDGLRFNSMDGDFW